MTIERIPLRNLMRLSLADQALETDLLRTNIRGDIAREEGLDGGGMSFYTPFWADAKNHARGVVDLRERTEVRVEANAGRRNLYPLLTEGFLRWWDERRRMRNEPFTVLEESVRGTLELRGLGTVVVDNIFAVRIGDDETQVIYPYFFDDPALSEPVAAWGLWAMSQALPDYRMEDMRILDIVRGHAYSLENAGVDGSEEANLTSEYRRLLARWAELRAEPRYN
ncbi:MULTISPECIES: hypothetical protein [unclassified Brevundimonas]|uniref:hypothetical protein n=1 Tax=unclassified Brevundimonas TaxID=2622653 RepID=UPI0025C1B084|nr:MULTISPECIES: hypothetical protein [unclassified Brevundimonas]